MYEMYRRVYQTMKHVLSVVVDRSLRVGRPGPGPGRPRDEAQPLINQRGIFSKCSDLENLDEEKNVFFQPFPCVLKY